MKCFMIPTGDDPEADRDDSNGADKPQAKTKTPTESGDACSVCGGAITKAAKTFSERKYGIAACGKCQQSQEAIV
jgi:hypothetical protein